ncbi:glycine cleavage T C-terminal barrel domain-containing protein [soil metagenome]
MWLVSATESTSPLELDAQYRELRESAGWLRRERALIRTGGSECREYLHSQLTQEIESLEPGEGTYAALLDRKGHMQSDARVLCLSDQEVLLDLETAGLPATLRHLTMYSVGRELEIADCSAEHAIFSVIGPAAFQLTGLAPLPAENAHAEATLGAVAVRAVRTDLGLDLICASSDVGGLELELEKAGLAAVGEQAAEIIRVETGRPRFGAEMTTKTIPQEADLNERAVSFTQGCYIGQETVARLHYKGKPNRHLRGLRLSAPASPGDRITLGERELGTIGTAVLSPALGPVALAIVRREGEPGTTVEVGDGNEAEIAELPLAGEPDF